MRFDQISRARAAARRSRLPLHVLSAHEHPRRRLYGLRRIRPGDREHADVALASRVAALVNASTPETIHRNLLLILLLVIPAEGINSVSMRKVGSPFFVPLAFLLLTVLGIALAWPA